MTDTTQKYMAANGVSPMLEVDNEQEIDLLELFFVLMDNVRYIILALIVGAVIAGVITKFAMVPKYESTAKLYVLNSSDSVLNLSDLQIGNYLASDYLEVFKTWEVNEQVKTNLGLPYSYQDLQALLTVSNPSNTRILYVTVTSNDPIEAANIANEYAVVARKYISSVMATEMPSILSNALADPNPVSPSLKKNVLIGAILGLLVAIGILTLIFILDDKIKNSDDITKATGLPVLAVVPIGTAVITGADAKKAVESRVAK